MGRDNEQIRESAPEQDGILQIADWSTWHDEYENSGSELNARKKAVQAQVAAIVDQCPPGPVTIVSICGGQAREVIGALENHPRRADVRGRVVELDTENATFARNWAQKAQLGNLEVVNGDASIAQSYADLPPVDLVVISGVFGHINDADRIRLVKFLSQICRNGGRVVWTFFRMGGDQSDKVRGFFREAMLEEESFDTLSGKYAFTIGRNRFTGAPAPLDPHARIFTFGSSREDRQEAVS